MIQDRDIRQRQIIPPEKLAAVKATVIGVGAIGRQAALQLAAIGVPWLQLIDFDIVEPANLAPQGYLEEDLGESKVQSTAALCKRLNSGVELHPEQGRYQRRLAVGNAIFLCVDSINTRGLIWNAVKSKADFVVDGRMSAEVLRVLTACTPSGRTHYPTTLFAQAEAYVGACTARSTIYCSNVAAGLMVGQFTKWLRGLPTEDDLSLNLLTAEFTVAA